MSYTIYYAEEDMPNEFIYILDREKSMQQLCTLIDNKYLLNYEHGSISTLPTDNSVISYRKKIADVI